MKNPIQQKVTGIFIPVSDVAKAKDWYQKVLGITEDQEVQSGHLCVLPLDGNELILDEMPKWTAELNERPKYQAPAFMILTDDIQASYEWMKDNGAEMVTEIEFDQWFAFKDPDGNMLMVCTG